MTNEQLEQFLAKCGQEVRDLQKVLVQKTQLNEYKTYLYDNKKNELKFTGEQLDELIFEIVPIGTWDYKEQVWEWAWANQNFDEAIREKASAYKNLAKETGFDLFEKEAFQCEEVVSRDLSYMAVHELKAKGIYRINIEDAYLYVALMSGCKLVKLI